MSVPRLVVMVTMIEEGRNDVTILDLIWVGLDRLLSQTPMKGFFPSHQALLMTVGLLSCLPASNFLQVSLLISGSNSEALVPQLHTPADKPSPFACPTPAFPFRGYISGFHVAVGRALCFGATT